MSDNKLYIFGDSFSYPFKIKVKNSWPFLLSKKLKFDLEMLSTPGSSNYQTFYRILNNLEKMKKTDIVIFNITWSDRYFIPVIEHGILGNDIRLKKLSDNDEKLGWLEKWFDKNVTEEDLIIFNDKTLNICLFLLNRLNIDFYYWNVGDVVIEDNTNNFILPPNNETTSFFYDWIEKDKSLWLDEQEQHFGINGHKKVCDHFFKFLSKGNK